MTDFKYPPGVLYTLTLHPGVRRALPRTVTLTQHVRRAVYYRLPDLATHTALPEVPSGKDRMSIRLPHPQLGQAQREAERLNTSVPALLRYLLTIHAAAFLRGEPDPRDLNPPPVHQPGASA